MDNVDSHWHSDWDHITNWKHIMKERFCRRTEKKQERLVEIVIMPVKEYIPQSVILEILSWLPVRILLQFKTVCKTWYDIISTPDFVSMHLKNQYNRDTGDTEDCLLVQDNINREYLWFELLVDETPRTVAASQVVHRMPMYSLDVCGPCDGIYYLAHGEDKKRALWNPAINELKYLPSITKPDPIPTRLIFASEVHGFGYDTKTKDYKVVVIKEYDDELRHEYVHDMNEVTHPPSVFVYSLKTDSWKYWGDLARKYYLRQSRCYIVVNGCFYWLGLAAKVIVSFDMGTDGIQEIQPPNYDYDDAGETLAIYDDCLSLVVVCGTVHTTAYRIDIWTLSEEGFWTKKFTMGCIPDVCYPIGHWKKNKVILECVSDRLALCDTETREIKELALEWRNDTMDCEGFFFCTKKASCLSDLTQIPATDSVPVTLGSGISTECSSYDLDLLFSDPINNRKSI